MNRIMHFLLMSALLFSVLMLTGCSSAEKTSIEETLVHDFNQIKELDTKTAEQYISSETLFPDAASSTTDAGLMEEFISLFFQDFDYKIMSIQVHGDLATAKLRLHTVDAQTLAKDFASQYLAQEILNASSSEESEALTETTLDDHYILLNKLLKENDYDNAESNCTVQLQKINETWVILPDDELENEIVGGFISYTANPSLLSPEETVDIYFSTFASMDEQQMCNYLNISYLLSTGDETNDKLTSALIGQVQQLFSYQVLDSKISGYNATVDVEVTTFDYEAILGNYNRELNDYLETPQAVYDGSDGRLNKSNEILLKCIEENDVVTTFTCPVTLTNDSQSWKMKTEGIGEAIFQSYADNNSSDTDSGTETYSSDETDDYSYEETDEDEGESSFDSDHADSYDSSDES